LETAVKRLYEGMFLVDSAHASDWDAVVKTIKKLLKRSGAEIVTIRNWAERRLAYEIDHKSRGTYVLCFFKADVEKIRNIEKDVQLSEQVMRVLILGTEGRKKDDIEKDMHGLPEEKETPKTVEPAEETTSPPQETEQDDESEQPVESIVADAIEPEKSIEPVAVDAIEPEQSFEPSMTDISEPEKPAEPASEDMIEPEKPAEPASVDAMEPEKPVTPETSETSEPEKPEKEQEPTKPEKKKFFNW
jgi:small subunit ribosomal protein S6